MGPLPAALFLALIFHLLLLRLYYTCPAWPPVRCYLSKWGGGMEICSKGVNLTLYDLPRRRMGSCCPPCSPPCPSWTSTALPAWSFTSPCSTSCGRNCWRGSRPSPPKERWKKGAPFAPLSTYKVHPAPSASSSPHDSKKGGFTCCACNRHTNNICGEALLFFFSPAPGTKN